MKRFFGNVGSELAAEIEQRNNSTIYEYLDLPTTHLVFLNETNKSEILEVVNEMKNKTSTDCNEVSMLVVKQVLNETVINTYKSFQSGIFQTGIKTANVVSIFKDGGMHHYTNNWPTSILSQFSRIIETSFDKRLSIFVDERHLLDEGRYGFRKWLSTVMAMKNFVEGITTSLDNEKTTIGVFIDLIKAFYTINNEVLVRKLFHYGVRAMVYQWIGSYLNDWQQYVEMNYASSSTWKAKCGVPHFSILGAKLFSMYIWHFKKLKRTIVHSICNDSNVFCSGTNIKMLSGFNNKLSLNEDKITWYLKIVQ